MRARGRATVSARADATGGTSAGLRRGDSVAVPDLLYALLLPSGNDAAVALAEHYGPRFQARWNLTTPVPAFVAEMNRRAAKLGLADTRYANPHGLDERGHYSSARDLVRLASAVLARDEARRYLGAKDARAGWSLERVMREATEAIANDGVYKNGTGGNIDSGGEKRRPWASRAFDARVQSRDDAQLGDAEGRKRRRKA